MKSILALVFCVLAVSSSASMPAKPLTFDGNDFLLVAKGLLEGIGAAEGWDELAPCVNATEDAVQSVVAAVKYLEQEDPVSVAQGLALLARALGDIPTAIQDCGAIVEDVEQLVKALEAIADPATFLFIVAKNLIINGVDIYDEIYGAVGDFRAGNWEHFGFNLGEALAKIFLYGTVRPRPALRDAGNVLLFLRGVVEGISTDPLFNEFAPCINNATSIGILVEHAVNDFIAGTTEKVFEGIKLLAQALGSIPDAIKDCGTAYPELQQLVDAVSQLKDPRTIVYRIARSLLINGQETWDKITDATTNINNRKYEEAGLSIGIILANFIRPDNAVADHRFHNFLQKRASFKVNPNHKFANWTRAQLKQLVGTKLQNPATTSIPQVHDEQLKAGVPTNFTFWSKWPQCQHPIINQAKCGSCWAFGAAETMTDRLCIATKGQINVQLSPQYLVSCSTGNMGCNGGILTLAWASIERSGLPTETCSPYTSAAGDVQSCSDVEKGCVDGNPFRRYYAKSWSTRWYISPNSIKNEIFTNGPVESAFTVYEDFLSYAGGVYKHTTGSALGGHAIKIVGWGVENGQEYWLVANSWGTTWGEQGYFKMAIGDSGMDNSAIVGAIDLGNLPKSFLRKELMSI